MRLGITAFLVCCFTIAIYLSSATTAHFLAILYLTDILDMQHVTGTSLNFLQFSITYIFLTNPVTTC